MDIEKIEKYLKDKGQPKYRFRQISENYFSGKFDGFLSMSNLPKNLRQELSKEIEYMSVLEDSLADSNSSHKAGLKLKDGALIETVLMEYRAWNTVCVSTQIGCAMDCLFCATGKMGLKRNLTKEEIVDQVIYWKQKKYKVSRVVFMGMGEPFLNWDQVYGAIKLIHDKIGIGWRKMSISTVGVVEGIDKLIETGIEINLAISLHSTKQSVRQKIMPGGSKYELKDIFGATRNYTAKIKRPVFFEYSLMDGINDSDQDASDLAQFIKSNRLFHLNMIDLNPIENSMIRSSTKERKDRFLAILDKNRTKYSYRASLGGNIKAACGQLITDSK